MTEAEWLAGTDPAPLLEYLGGRAGERKLRLLAVACYRRLRHWDAAERGRRTVEVAERFADGRATAEELKDAAKTAWAAARDGWASGRPAAGDAARAAAAVAWEPRDLPSPLTTFLEAARAITWAAARERDPANPLERSAVRDAARAAERKAQAGLTRELFGNPFRPLSVNPAWVRWQGGTVLAVARAIYGEGRFGDLPVLADALEEAGCQDTDFLDHCRSQMAHARGCWLVDALLGNR